MKFFSWRALYGVWYDRKNPFSSVNQSINQSINTIFLKFPLFTASFRAAVWGIPSSDEAHARSAQQNVQPFQHCPGLHYWGSGASQEGPGPQQSPGLHWLFYHWNGESMWTTALQTLLSLGFLSVGQSFTTVSSLLSLNSTKSLNWASLKPIWRCALLICSWPGRRQPPPLCYGLWYTLSKTLMSRVGDMPASCYAKETRMNESTAMHCSRSSGACSNFMVIHPKVVEMFPCGPK